MTGMTKMTPEAFQERLQSFTGTDNHHGHSIHGVRFTDGVRFVADAAEAHWLIDAIATHLMEPQVRDQPFTVWTLRKLDKDNSTGPAELVCTDGNHVPLGRRELEFTTFPVQEVILWVQHPDPQTWVILLPSEK
jgi:hypothetical protein